MNLATENYRYLVLILSILYGLFLANLPIDVFKDRIPYLNYAENSLLIFLSYLNDGFLSVISNEPVWLGLNILLSSIFNPEMTVRLLIGVSASISAFYTLMYNSKYFIILLLFLFFPLVIKNYIIHLRQGVAISVFLIGWFSNNNKIKRLIFITPFIHASFIFMLFIIALSKIFKSINIASDVKVFLYTISSIFVGSSLSFFSSLVGARQAEQYDFTSADVSGLGFIFWFIVLSIFLSSNKIFVKKYLFEVGLIVFYLSTYFLIEVTGRVFESGIIFVLLSGISLTRERRIFFIIILLVFTVILYLIRLNQPYLGWGA